MAASLTLLKQVVNASELIPDEAQPVFEIRKGVGGRRLLLPDTLRSSSSLRHDYGGYLFA